MTAPLIYKICTAAQWEEAVAVGRFDGAPADIADGYIHFSTAGQVAETARRHFSARRDLLLVAVNADALGPALKWEPSRGGDLFPHLYAALPVSAAASVDPLPPGDNGVHVFPQFGN